MRKGQAMLSKLVIVLIGVLILCLPAQLPAQGKADKELSQGLQGTWVVAHAEMEGRPLPDEVTKKMKIVIEGKRYTLTYGDKIEEWTFQLNADKNPAWFDLTLKGEDGPALGLVFLVTVHSRRCHCR